MDTQPGGQLVMTRLTPEQATTSASPCKPIPHFRLVHDIQDDQKSLPDIVFREKPVYGCSKDPGRASLFHSQDNPKDHIRKKAGWIRAICEKKGRIFSFVERVLDVIVYPYPDVWHRFHNNGSF